MDNLKWKAVIEKNAIWWLLLATALFYSKSLFFEFLNFDDGLYITGNPQVKDFDLKAVLYFFTNTVFGHYFPFTMLTYGVQSAIHGLDPFYFHAFNLFIHLAATAVAFHILAYLLSHRWQVLLATALFAVHPLQIESVVWVGTRGTILSGLFSLLSLLYYLHYVNKGQQTKHMIWAVVWLFFGLLSKSNALILPLIFFLFDWHFKRSLKLNLLLEKLPLLLLSFIAGVIAILAGRELGSIDKDFSETTFGLERLVFILNSLSFYFNKFWWPFNLSAMHYDPELVDRRYPLGVYLSILPSLGFIIALFALRFANRFYRMVLVYYLLSYVLVINIVPLGGTFASERYAYIGNLSLMALLPYLLEQLSKRFKAEKLIKPIALAVILAFGTVAYARMNVWSDSLTLFKSLLAYNATNDHAHGAIAKVYSRTKEYDKALFHINKAIEKNPTAKHHTSRAAIKLLMDSLESARKDIDYALRINPGGFPVYLERAIVKETAGDYVGALEDYSLVTQLAPNTSVAWFNRGFIKYKLGDRKGACEDFIKAAELGYDYAKEISEKICQPQLSNKKEQKFTVLKEVTYNDGTVALRVSALPDSSKQMLQRFDPSGNLVEEGEINDKGEYNGAVTWYYTDGKVKTKGYYEGIIPTGQWEEYYENGNLKSKYQFEKGTINGVYLYFYEDGKPWTSREFKNGRLYTVNFVIGHNGDTLSYGNLENGTGNLIIYDENSQAIDTMQYVNGKNISEKN